MKDDHEKGTHLVMGVIIVAVLVFIFVAFIKSVMESVNAGYGHNDIIWKASDGAYINEGPYDIK